MDSETYTVQDDGNRGILLLPKGDHLYTLIFLHGLGDSAEGFVDVFAENDVVPATCKVVLPTAPRKPVSCNNGYVMNSWFDIYNLSGTPESLEEIRKEYSQDDLKESIAYLTELVRKEADLIEGKDTKRVFIGGFSQGCMVSLATLISIDF